MLKMIGKISRIHARYDTFLIIHSHIFCSKSQRIFEISESALYAQSSLTFILIKLTG